MIAWMASSRAVVMTPALRAEPYHLLKALSCCSRQMAMPALAVVCDDPFLSYLLAMSMACFDASAVIPGIVPLITPLPFRFGVPLPKSIQNPFWPFCQVPAHTGPGWPGPPGKLSLDLSWLRC